MCRLKGRLAVPEGVDPHATAATLSSFLGCQVVVQGRSGRLARMLALSGRVRTARLDAALMVLEMSSVPALRGTLRLRHQNGAASQVAIEAHSVTREACRAS